MRRYIAVMMLLVATLATSCKLYDGENYKPINVGKEIAQEAHRVLCDTNFVIRLTLACDAYLATDDEALREAIMKDVFEPYGYSIEYDATANVIKINNSAVNLMTYKSSGGLLSENGVWSLDGNYTAVYTPTDGGVKIDIEFPDGYTHSGVCTLFVSDVVCDIENSLNYNLTGSFELNFEYDKTTLNSVITEALRYSNKHYTSDSQSTYFRYEGFVSGSMSVVYDDFSPYAGESVHMTYKDSETIEVEYYGQKGTIPNYSHR